LVLLSLGATPGFAQTFTTLDDPLGVNGTWASGIAGNNVVGSYKDSSGATHGFLFNGSSYAPLDDPSAANVGLYHGIETINPGTHACGISGGNIVGYYTGSTGEAHGFLYDGSSYVTLDDPLGAYGTYAFGVSGGNVVGVYLDSSRHNHGFLYNGSSYTTLDDPLAANDTVPSGISGNNIVGNYLSTSGAALGFLYDGTSYTTLYGPSGNVGIWPSGISGSNIVGSYTASGGFGAQYLFGFLYNGSCYTSVDDPLEAHGPGPVGACGTAVAGIDGNSIVGVYNNSTGAHSFVATVPEPSTIALLGASAIGLTAFAWRRRTLTRSADNQEKRP
jgi:hypothetical protein